MSQRDSPDEPPSPGTPESTGSAPVNVNIRSGTGGMPSTSSARSRRSPGLARLIVGIVSILWFTGELWAAYRGIRDSGGGSFAVAAATNALPAVMQAALLAGLGAGLIAAVALSRAKTGSRSASGVLRWAVTIVAGLAVGLAGLGGILIVYGHTPTLSGIAASVVIAAVLGASMVGIRRDPAMATAGLVAALAGAVVATVLNSGRVVAQMMSAFGGHAGASPAAIVSANSIVSHLDAAIVGIVAGVVAYRVLRGRAGRGGVLTYLAVGALTGLLLLVSEAFIRIGGAGLLHATRLISLGDDISVSELASARVIGGLLVLFIGAFVALLGYGRSLPSRARVPLDPPTTASAVPAPPAQRSS